MPLPACSAVFAAQNHASIADDQTQAVCPKRNPVQTDTGFRFVFLPAFALGVRSKKGPSLAYGPQPAIDCSCSKEMIGGAIGFFPLPNNFPSCPVAGVENDTVEAEGPTGFRFREEQGEEVAAFAAGKRDFYGAFLFHPAFAAVGGVKNGPELSCDPAFCCVGKGNVTESEIFRKGCVVPGTAAVARLQYGSSTADRPARLLVHEGEPEKMFRSAAGLRPPALTAVGRVEDRAIAAGDPSSLWVCEAYAKKSVLRGTLLDLPS